MGRPLSNDLRHRVISAVEEGSSASAAARRFGVGRSTVVDRNRPTSILRCGDESDRKSGASGMWALAQ